MALPIIGADERIEQVIEPGSILCPPRLRRDAKGAQSHTPQMNLLASGN